MPLILAIEPDRRQASKIATLARTPLHAELVASETTEQAVASLGGRVPDLILTSLLLSPKDEAALADWLRELDAAGTHVQTLVIPVLGTAPRRARKEKGLLTRLRGSRGKDAATEGCDPAVFATQIAEYLERVAEERRATATALEDEIDDIAAAAMRPPLPTQDHSSVVGPTFRSGASGDTRTPELKLGPTPVAQFIEPPPVVEPEPVEVVLASEPVAQVIEPEPVEASTDIVSEVATDEVWEAVVIEEPAEPGLELTSEAIDLDAFAEELKAFEGSARGHAERFVARHQRELALGLDPQRQCKEDEVLADFVAALEVIETSEVVDVELEDEPDSPGIHSEADSDLWMPLSLASFWPPLEGGVAKSALIVGAELAPPEGRPRSAPTTHATTADAPAAPPTPPPPATPEWVQLLTALRHDIQQLRADLPEVAAPPPEPPASRPRAATPTPPASSTGDRSRKKKKSKTLPPPQDEWGFFDPAQCGFAALLAKLEEISEEDPPEKPRR